MSELMIPIPFKELMNWVTAEYEREGSVFGVHRPYTGGEKFLRRWAGTSRRRCCDGGHQTPSPPPQIRR